ncbi:DoxX family protein [Billgrantia endophytica]|uniref:Crp/Fnr family transcriptional regulator n=1 Tax=Billgrantia endophytica TaxID=2033802 RepID=A0A2N7U3V7_9GAMM|nr:DoxX family protein [Halomonas endophytica]PMR75100.1 Crp/Fnr family transcriptional regulator [Halomonas endophytica]
MLGEFFRKNQYAAGMWLLLRLYLGITWLTLGWGKITGGFSAEWFLADAVENPVMREGSLVYPNYVAFLERFALPYADLISFCVAWGELLVGLGLIFGVLTSAAAFFAIVMNMSFLMAGTVSINPWMIMLSIFLLVAGANAGRYGGDHWVLPYLRARFGLR